MIGVKMKIMERRKRKRKRKRTRKNHGKMTLGKRQEKEVTGGRKTPENRGSTSLIKMMTVEVRGGRPSRQTMATVKKSLEEAEEIRMIAVDLGGRRDSFVAIWSSIHNSVSQVGHATCG